MDAPKIAILVAVLGLAALDGCSNCSTNTLHSVDQTSEISSWDDAILASRFLQKMKESGYPPIQELWMVDSKLDMKLRDMNRELHNRGQGLWEKVYTEDGFLDAQRLDDAKVVEFLLATPAIPERNSKRQALYAQLISTVLARCDWDWLAVEWPWYGLERLSDRRLCDLLRCAQNGMLSERGNLDSLLNEMVHRGGREFENCLSSWLREADFGETRLNLEVLTALRRLQGLPDPMTVRLKQPLKQVTTFPDLPILDLELVNQDPEGRDIVFMAGGDYRGGRLARWRVDAVDEHGNHIRELPAPSDIGGGIGGPGISVFQHNWPIRLSVGAYLPALPSGEYTLQVMYHDTMRIADRDDISGLIMCYSPKIHLTVKKAVGRVQIIPVPVKIVPGDYDDHHFCDFLPSDSPNGQSSKQDGLLVYCRPAGLYAE